MDLLRLQTGIFRRRIAVHCLELSAGPDVAAIRLNVGHAIERFHRSVGEVRQFINGLEPLERSAESGACIAILLGHGSGFLSEFGVLGALRPAVQRCQRTFVPYDLKRLASAFRRPESIRHDSHPAFDVHHVAHAGNGLCLVRVETFHFAAENRAARHHRHKHPWHCHVESEDCFAIRLVRRVQPFGRLADQLEILRVFQRHILRRR